eukprot:gnl/TRDRNA2_/TRDRNA2_86712_c1_seq1.p1 gnl/TRDRNA2_/TRDRNA2_86712_c1~~gnl/TRDRNA2_/TRDRNA2_86712_c1_seq1.p1  ORF type:complete len:306 (-),score=67.65 gnl/TRDRNA2_/TRDRNA2_86712_c1_seq1:39-920(-)
MGSAAAIASRLPGRSGSKGSASSGSQAAGDNGNGRSAEAGAGSQGQLMGGAAVGSAALGGAMGGAAINEAKSSLMNGVLPNRSSGPQMPQMASAGGAAQNALPAAVVGNMATGEDSTASKGGNGAAPGCAALDAAKSTLPAHTAASSGAGMASAGMAALGAAPTEALGNSLGSSGTASAGAALGAVAKTALPAELVGKADMIVEGGKAVSGGSAMDAVKAAVPAEMLGSVVPSTPPAVAKAGPSTTPAAVSPMNPPDHVVPATKLMAVLDTAQMAPHTVGSESTAVHEDVVLD